MTRTKINHPFKVPEGFFDDLENELLMKVETGEVQNRKKTLLLQVLKYAAIIILAVFLGRESTRLFPGKKNMSVSSDTISVDLVLSQVSDEDITDFFIDNVTNDVFTKIKSR
jgi:hypothetical protein